MCSSPRDALPSAICSTCSTRPGIATTTMEPQTFSRRLIDGATMFVVTGLSLLLLVYVGFGEAKRTYEEFNIEKLVAQGSIAQNSIENYLRAGLPLKQYVGFTNLAEPIVENEDIDALTVYDLAGRQLFFVTDKSKPKLPEPPPVIKQIKDKMEVDSSSSHYQVVRPLRTRFETVGSVVVVSPKTVVTKRLDDTFRPLVFLLLGLSVAFAVFVSLAAPYLARTRAPWLQVAYGLTFLGMAAFVVGSLISLYSDGIQGKAKETAFTLSQRLSDVVEFNLRIRDFESLDKTRQVHVAVSVPGDLVYHRVERSVRNFAALFVASCFFAGLFLQVAAAMQRLRQAPAPSGTTLGVRVREESALAVVKPIFFLAVFIESLTYSFLPRFMQDVATTAGVSSGFASAPFTTYYLCFALSLIPAGHFSERHGPRALIWSGLLLAGMSMLSLTMPLGIVLATVARGVSGIGQGMLFIGIQAYILAVASPEKKTQGAAIIVFGFQGGMISGMAIGSLLVSYLQPQGVFAIGGAVGLATALYSAVLMPRGRAPERVEGGFGAALTRVGGDMLRVMRSTEFLKTMFLIGVPAKAILTGIITFALPLLLGQEGYRQEEIGQVIMLYALAVVASSSLISRMVDRTGRTESMLFWGAVISGFGLVLIGFMGSNATGHGTLSTALV